MKKFFVGQWKVLVDRRLIVGPDGEKRLQPKVMEVLAYLAQRPGEVVSREQLIRDVWSGRVVTDEVLSRSISLLRASLGDEPQNPSYIETIAKSGYRMIAKVSNDGAVAESQQTVAGRASRNLVPFYLALTVALAVAGLWFLNGSQNLQQPTAPNSNALAVLPFENMSSDERDTYFSDGVSEEILNVLAKDPELLVVARTSSFQFREDKDAREIGRLLNVAHIVDGSIRASGDEIRITAQLIRTQDGAQVWSMSENYRRSDVLAIQMDIAQAIATQLRGVVSEVDTFRRYQTPSVEAFDALLLGRDRLQNRTVASLREAARFFERAIELDPSYPLAYVGLADAYALIHEYGDFLSAEEMLALAQPLLQKAVVLDPQLGEAYTSIGGLHRVRENYYDAEAAFVRAIELSPNYATARQWYGYLLSIQMGRIEEGLVQMQKAKELDPISPIINKNLADALNSAGRFDEAIEQYIRVMEIDPNFPGAFENLAATYRSGYGRLDESVLWLKKAIQLDDENPAYTSVLSQNYLDLGDLEQAQSWYEISAQTANAGSHFPALARMYFSLHNDASIDVRASAAVVLNTFPRHVGALEALRILDLRVGDGASALARLQSSYGHLLESDKPLTVAGKDGAIELAYLMRLSGDLDQALQLESMVEDYIATHPRMGYAGYGVADVKLAMIREDPASAMQALEQAIADGFRTRVWLLDLDPMFALLRARPGYDALRSELQEDLNRMLALTQR